MKQLTGREFDDRWLLQFGEVSRGLNLRFFQFFEDFWNKKIFYVNVICTRYGSVFCRRTQKRVEKRPSGQWVSAAGEVLAPPPPHFEGARELKSGQSTQDRKMKKTLYCYSHQQPSALRNPGDRSELNKIISY